MTCLASILIMVAYNMSGWRTFGHMIKTAPKSDITVLIVTFVLTVFFDLVVAIEVGMAFARDVADEIIFMDEGYIVEQGKAREVIEHPKEERTKQFLSRYTQG